MKAGRIAIVLGTTIALLAVSFWWMERAEAPGSAHDDTQTVFLTAPDGSVRRLSVEIADDADERAEGLMFRTDLPAGTGMLFVFPESLTLNFWMKNTYIPLDILYFDGEGIFVSRTTMEPCTKDPCMTYSSNAPALYALEVNQGESVAAGVGTGWILTR